MGMTAAQQATLGTDIGNNANTIGGVQIKNLTHTPDNAVAVAAWYNQFPASDYYVWNSAVKVVDILNNVTFVNYTPNDSPTGTDIVYNNRAFNVQIKQQNLALLFLNRTTFDATRVNLRSALNDATTNLLTGTSGASRSGGWSNILPILSRKATNGEVLFATDDGAGIGNTTTDPRGANTNPDAPGFEGLVSDADVRAAWGI
jgi:hypothetical protein